MRRSLSDTALDGGGALVPEPLPARPLRRKSTEPALQDAAPLQHRSSHLSFPADPVASFVGPRTARNAVSARLQQVCALLAGCWDLAQNFRLSGHYLLVQWELCQNWYRRSRVHPP